MIILLVAIVLLLLIGFLIVRIIKRKYSDTDISTSVLSQKYGKGFIELKWINRKPLLEGSAEVHNSTFSETPFGLPQKECIVSIPKKNVKDMFEVFEQIEKKINWSCYQYIRTYGSDTIEYGYTSCLQFNTHYFHLSDLLNDL